MTEEKVEVELMPSEEEAQMILEDENYGEPVEEKAVRIDVIDGKLSVSSSTSLVDTLMMLNAGMQFVLERAMVNQQVAEEEEEQEEE